MPQVLSSKSVDMIRFRLFNPMLKHQVAPAQLAMTASIQNKKINFATVVPDSNKSTLL